MATNKIKIIDPHLHLFDLTKGDYQWLSPNNPPFWPDKDIISKNFSEQDLTLLAPLSLAGFVHIEAGFDNEQPWREIQWLEQHCNLPFRSIAAIDLTLPETSFIQQLDKLSAYLSVVGIRHIFDEQALSLLTNNQVITNFKILDKRALIFELQMPFCCGDSVNALREVISANENISFIINHAGFPPLDTSSNNWTLWQKNLLSVAHYKNVAIKCSGWEMISREYTPIWQGAAVKFCIEAFSYSRVMLASNFPLVLFALSYQSYWQTIVEQLDENHQQALLNDNATLWYKLPIS